jgi:Fic-DOC domain mobile mystery protein B
MADETTGATPGDDASGLLQPQLTTKAARDATELEAISLAYDNYIYLRRRNALQVAPLSDSLIRQVHLDMFGTIWEWAGKYRKTNLNMGVDWRLIPEKVQELCGNFNYWNSSESKMPELEIAARLQNHLTRIHPFKNGNGRHARLMTDIFFDSRDFKLPMWPQVQLVTAGNEIRNRYIIAQKAADQEDYSQLMQLIEEYIEEKS